MARQQMTEQERRDERDAQYVRGAKTEPSNTTADERAKLDGKQVEETKRLLSEKGAGAGGREAEKKFGKSAMSSREAQEAQRQVKVRKAAGNRQRELRERAASDAKVKSRTPTRDRMLDAERARHGRTQDARSR